VTDRTEESAVAVAGQVIAAGGTSTPIAVDVTDRMSVRAAVGPAAEVAGPPTILVNNAGAWIIKRFLDRDPDLPDSDIDVSLGGVINLCREFVPAMVERGRGSVVNVTSEGGRMGQIRMATYSAAKAGVVGFSKALAREVGGRGVRVNCVSPSITKTDTNVAIRESWNEANVLKDFPLNRLGEPVDQANAVLFLASDLSSWITGQVISVNGGYVM
jgi:NAD(P)-dependent dehydrogenase (short-subunit alcohol dehydrogenase family)